MLEFIIGRVLENGRFWGVCAGVGLDDGDSGGCVVLVSGELGSSNRIQLCCLNGRKEEVG